LAKLNQFGHREITALLKKLQMRTLASFHLSRPGSQLHSQHNDDEANYSEQGVCHGVMN